MSSKEITGNIDNGFDEWTSKLEKMDDISASREVFNRIMAYSDLDPESKELLKDSYEYCTKLIRIGKPLEPNLLKIYLEQLKGYEINQVKIVNLIMVLGCCGIIFK